MAFLKKVLGKVKKGLKKVGKEARRSVRLTLREGKSAGRTINKKVVIPTGKLGKKLFGLIK